MVPAKDGIFGIGGNAESTTYGRHTGARGTNPTLTAILESIAYGFLLVPWAIHVNSTSFPPFVYSYFQ
jgi:hypothetical protein